MKSYLKRKKEWFAVPVCHGESVLDKTWYHFFFAVLLPLIDLCRKGLFDQNQRIYIKSCGQFNRVLKELIDAGMINLVVLPDIEVLQRLESIGADIEYFVLDSLEAFFFRHGRFCVRPFVASPSTLASISEYATKHLLSKDNHDSDVLIIDRELGQQGHGATTRCVPNLSEIGDALKKEGYMVKTVSLEGASLAYQMSLFHGAKVVVAQHGSCLSNMIWMQRTKGSVCEIVPPSFRQAGWQYFSILADTLAIPRIEIPQEHEFAAVEPEIVAETVHKLLKSDRLDSVSRLAAR